MSFDHRGDVSRYLSIEFRLQKNINIFMNQIQGVYKYDRLE